jgi:virulence factor Mce-like protein
MPTRSRQPSLFSSPILVGAIMILLGGVGVVLSYSANRGLPFVPTYEINVDVPDAAELIQGSSEVRLDGARVGIVKEVVAEPARGSRPAYARLHLALDKTTEGLPVDTRAQVRPRSILGAKYVALTAGRSKQEIPAGGSIPLKQVEGIVELDEAFNTFDKETRKGLQDGIRAFGNAVAGRGAEFNNAVGSAGKLVGPLQRVLGTLADPATGLDRFIRGAAAFTSALAPVSSEFGDFIDNGAATFNAIVAAGPALGQAVHELASTEQVGTRALGRLGPVLDDLVAVTTSLRPASYTLPAVARHLDESLVAGTPVLARVKGDRLKALLGALDKLSRDRGFTGALKDLVPNATNLGSVLNYLAPAQTQCNMIGLWAHNIASTFSRGDADGGWINFQSVFDVPQMLQNPVPSIDLHLNYYPHNNEQECESGNEPYLPGQRIGNPPGLQPNRTASIKPSPSARAYARRAGLLELPAGLRP